MHPFAQRAPESAGLGAQLAFDALYTAHAPGLVRQVYLLTGRLEPARQAVERAFHRAWQRWPEVAVDSDPAGWVRAAAHEHALAPWRRSRPSHRRRLPPRHAQRGRPAHGPGADDPLVTALLALPPSYRRAVVLHDGVGLPLAETAAEVEASTAATIGRLVHARAALAERLPAVRGVPPVLRGEVLHRMLGELAAAQPVLTSSATAVRLGSERRARLWTRAALAVTALFAAAALLTTVVDRR